MISTDPFILAIEIRRSAVLLMDPGVGALPGDDSLRN